MKIKRKEVKPPIPMVIHKDLGEAFEAIYQDLKKRDMPAEQWERSERVRHAAQDSMREVNAPARPDAADGGN